jgi:hypothetical protein
MAGSVVLDEATVEAAAAALYDADPPPLPPDPEFPTAAAFAAQVDAWHAGGIPVPGWDVPSVPGTHRQSGPEPDWDWDWDVADPWDLDASDLVPYRPGTASRVEVLEWQVCGADERDEAEAAMLALRGPAWATLPPGGELATALEATRPSTESPVALIELMRACDREIGWLESIKVAAIAAFTAHRAREAETEPYARSVDDTTGRPADPERSCAAELAAALKVSPATVGPWIDNAQRLITDLGDTYRLLRCGQITLSKALALLEATAALPLPAQHAVEARVLGRAPDQTHAQFRASLRRAVARVDTRETTTRHRDAMRDRTCRKHDLGNGMAGIWFTNSADKIQQAWIAIQALADRAKTDHPDDARTADTPTASRHPADQPTADQPAADQRTADQRRADSAVDVFGQILANGTDWLDRPLPTKHRRRPHIEVTIAASTLLGLDDEPGELAGYGPIPADLARQIAADGTWRRLLTDPATGTVLEAYTTRHDPAAQVSETLLARHPVCSWIGCNKPARDCDRDHGTKYRHTGKTTLRDLRPYCEYHHVIKDNDHWGWTTTNHPDGTTRIVAPTGHVYMTYPPARGPAIGDPLPQATDPDPPPF